MCCKCFEICLRFPSTDSDSVNLKSLVCGSKSVTPRVPRMEYQYIRRSPSQNSRTWNKVSCLSSTSELLFFPGNVRPSKRLSERRNNGKLTPNAEESRTPTCWQKRCVMCTCFVFWVCSVYMLHTLGPGAARTWERIQGKTASKAQASPRWIG